MIFGPDPHRLKNRPGKEAVRAWMRQRRMAATPPPSMEEIRRALGWDGARKRGYTRTPD
jgi:hypothetical protein